MITIFYDDMSARVFYDKEYNHRYETSFTSNDAFDFTRTVNFLVFYHGDTCRCRPGLTSGWFADVDEKIFNEHLKHYFEE